MVVFSSKHIYLVISQQIKTLNIQRECIFSAETGLSKKMKSRNLERFGYLTDAGDVQQNWEDKYARQQVKFSFIQCTAITLNIRMTQSATITNDKDNEK